MENTFFVSLTKEQKRKYTSYSVSSFEYAKYIETHTLYNDVMPMFSYLVDAIRYKCYAKYLLVEIEQIELTEAQTAQSRSSILINGKPCEQKRQSSLVKKPIRFQSDFTDQQIEILPSCINKIQLFTTYISPKMLKDFYVCKLKGISSPPRSIYSLRIAVYNAFFLCHRMLIS